MGGEAEGRLDLEAGPAAFLLVAGDPFPAPGVHRLEAKQAVRLTPEECPALLTGVDADRDRVVIAARLAASGVFGINGAVHSRRAGQLHPHDFVTGALVVDEGARPKLSDGHEPGALQVAAFAPCVELAEARDVGGQREAGEGVAGQEPLGRQVAVGVEVGLHRVALVVRQQPQPVPGFALALAAVSCVSRDGTGGDGQLALVEILGPGDAVQIAPAVQRPVQVVGRPRDGVGDPTVVPPTDRVIGGGP